MTQLSGKDLDIAVGLANGWTIRPMEFNSGRWILPDGSHGMLVDVYKPSSLWMHGGPVWDETDCDMEFHGDHWKTFGIAEAQGATKLEAICRAYLAMKGQK